MGTNTVRLDDDVYERPKSSKRDDETFSEAVDRLLGEWTPLDFAEGEPPVDADTHRELLDDIERHDIEATAQRLRESESDG